MRNFDKKIFNLPTFMFLWSQSLHISQIHWVFCLIFAGIKTKTSHRYHFYDLKVHFWWLNKRFIWGRSSWKTLYKRCMSLNSVYDLNFQLEQNLNLKLDLKKRTSIELLPILVSGKMSQNQILKGLCLVILISLYKCWYVFMWVLCLL